MKRWFAAVWPALSRTRRRRYCGTSAARGGRNSGRPESGRLLRVESLESRALLSVDPAGIAAVGPPPESAVAAPSNHQTAVFVQAASVLPILRGEVKAGTISARGEVDRFTFRGAAGDRVFISLSEQTPLSGDFWGRAALFSPTGVKIGTVSDGFSRVFKLPVAGKYTIRVYDWVHKATGDYALALEGIKPASLDAVTIERGDVKAGRIDAPGEVDAYRFTGKAGDRVFLSLSDLPGDFWGRATLYTPGGTAVGTVSDAFGKSFALPVSGTYVILVYDWKFTSPGDYALALEGVSPASLDAAAINRGDVKAGTIDAPGDVDAYTFTGAANDTVFLALSEVSDLPGYWGQATLYSPTGAEVGTVSGGAFSKAFKLPVAGKYVILVHDWTFTGTGEYALDLEGINPASLDAVAVNRGDAKAGSIDVPGEVDAYTFTGAANDTVFLALSETFALAEDWGRATLYSPTGTEVGTVSGGAFSKSFRLPVAGTYVVLVYDWMFTGTGGYALALEGINPASLDAAAINRGDMRTGGIDVAGEVDAYSFTGAVSDTVSLALSGLSGNIWGRATLYSPSGTALGTVSEGFSGSYTLPVAGTYLVLVYDWRFTDLGDYELTLAAASSV